MGIVIKQNKRPRLQDVLNENGNVIIRSRRHLIPTNEKFKKKFSYGNNIPITNRLLESVTPQQNASWPKPISSSTTINSLKSIPPNRTKVINQDVFPNKNNNNNKKASKYNEQCSNMLLVFLVVFQKEDLVTLREHYKINWKRDMLCYWFTLHHDTIIQPQFLSCHIINFIDHITS